MNHAILIMLLALTTPALAQVDRYTYYGGEVDAEGKSEAIEECEYRELVENQHCNERVNKTQCIREVHARCSERFGKPDDGNPEAGKN